MENVKNDLLFVVCNRSCSVLTAFLINPLRHVAKLAEGHSPGDMKRNKFLKNVVKCVIMTTTNGKFQVK